jgi:hypothetical protein
MIVAESVGAPSVAELREELEQIGHWGYGVKQPSSILAITALILSPRQLPAE